jgi:hypothetical protein
MIASKPRTYADVKVLARFWLRDVGCRIFRSANVSDKEQNAWIEQLFRESNDDSVATGVVRRCQAGKQKHDAYLISKRTPDPNNTARCVTNFWLFVDPRGQLTSSQLIHFAKDPCFPASQEEFELAVHRILSQLPSGTVSQPECSVSPAGTKATSGIRMAIKTLAVLAVVAVGIVAVGIVAGWWWSFDTPDKHPVNDPSIVHPPSIDQRWDADEIRVEIKSAINNAGVIDGPIPNLNDQELLTTFIELFRVTDSELEIDASDRENMNARKKPESHPFLAFLAQFPGEIPKIESGQNKTWPELCAATLIPLAKGSGDAIEDANPREIIQILRNQLNYTDFYRRWHDKVTPTEEQEPFVESWDSNDPANQWQRKVRDYIKKHY